MKQDTPEAEEFYKSLGGEPSFSGAEKDEAMVEPVLMVGGVSNSEFQLERLQVFSQLDLPQNDIAILDVQS